MKVINFYHSTNHSNALSILENNVLAPNPENGIAGFEKDTISVSDLFHRYLSVIFGNVIFEFNADKLMNKNNIYPAIYDEADKENFFDMAFEESEWKSKRIIFNYSDINKIYLVNDGFLGMIEDIVNKENIKIETIREDEMPDYSYDFCLNRYYKRIEKYAV